MNENKPNVDDLEKELDLSSMIDEYEEDQGLRQKIEQMKQAKANQKETTPIHVEDSALFVPRQSATHHETYTANKKMDDEELGKTRILPSNRSLDDGDKTLVIMDNQRAKAYHQAEQKQVEDEESIFVYDNREVEEEEITEEDIKEFLGEETKKPRTPMDPNKKNKIITYVIAGCVALLLLGGVGFGIKMLFDRNDTPVDEPTGTTKDPIVTPKDPVEPNKPTEEPEKPVEEPKTPDNSIRIAEIKGELKGLDANLTTLKGSKEEKEKKLETAKNKSKEKQDEISPIQSQVDNVLKQDMEVKEKAYNKLMEDKKATEAALTKAKSEMEKAQKAWNEKVQEITKLNTEKKVFDDEAADLKAEIDDIESQIDECNDKIDALNTELKTLQ